MPMYDYRCEACGKTFEKMVRLDAPAPPCPDCGAPDPKKLISPVAFQLKGGGWYKDHYGLKSGASSGGGSSEGGTTAPTPAAASSGGSEGGGSSSGSSA